MNLHISEMSETTEGRSEFWYSDFDFPIFFSFAICCVVIVTLTVFSVSWSRSTVGAKVVSSGWGAIIIAGTTHYLILDYLNSYFCDDIYYKETFNTVL